MSRVVAGLDILRLIASTFQLGWRLFHMKLKMRSMWNDHLHNDHLQQPARRNNEHLMVRRLMLKNTEKKRKENQSMG